MDWFIDLRAHSHGGPIGTLKVGDGTTFFTDLTDFFNALHNRDVIFMAHGYNVNRQHGTDALNQWKEHLGHVIGDNPVFVGVLWPGDCVLPIFIDYVWEGSEAETAGRMLGAFVRDKVAPLAASLSFFSHSLGARVVLNALAQLADPIRVRHLVMMAAAVEDDTLLNEFHGSALRADKVTVVYSYEDEVLKLAYPAGNLLGGLFERHDANLKVALGRAGPSAPWPGKILPNPQLPVVWQYGHTDYTTTKPVLEGGAEYFISTTDTSIPASATTDPIFVPDDLQKNAQWKPCWSAFWVGNRWISR